MKQQVTDPVAAARRVGGATWEPEAGWWVQTTGPPIPGAVALAGDQRDAIYIPSRDREGRIVSWDEESELR